jgi:polysaccharide pyruvyl transferase CsaB
MFKLVISGYYGFDNLGDEAILAGMVSALRRQGKELKIIVLSAQPDLTASRYGVQAVKRSSFPAVFREISSSDLFISGGGSLLQDVTGWKSIPYYLGQVFLARLLGKKTVFYAQGIGPIRSKINRILTGLVANRTDLITVRDQDSLAYLLNLGVTPDLINITVDPVFALKDKHREAGIQSERPLIGISVRSWRDSSYLEKVARAADDFADLIGGEIIVIPLHYRQDQEISRQLVSLLRNKAGLLQERYSPLEILEAFAGLDFVIGVRLHALIFAALHNLPFVSISYDPKIDGFLKMLELPPGLRIEELTSEGLVRECNQLWHNREGFIKQLEKKTNFFYRKAIENAGMVLDLLK